LLGQEWRNKKDGKRAKELLKELKALKSKESD